jgi:tetratricopeptide (TPR) repeat protein
MNQKLNIAKGLTIICLIIGNQLFAQFHTLNIPQASNYVQETQRLGITDITITYHSPATRGRDVWNNPGIIPQNGDPIAWRAGANMNTTIAFSTDVIIEGEPLEAGTYGFHIIPRDGKYELLFAHASHQWGSYYLDTEADVSLKALVDADTVSFSEKLDYEFSEWQEGQVTISLEWGNRRIPFQVAVDLNETVVNSFRSELRGLNTYRWEAWNDAARWCLNHDTNLEEALSWADRSINGGYNGFASNKNANNLQTKAELLAKLDRQQELDLTIQEAIELNMDEFQTNYFSIFLLRSEKYQQAQSMLVSALKRHEDVWFLYLNKGLSDYFLGNKKSALKMVAETKKRAPENFMARLTEIEEEIKTDSYQLPGR